ncbi:MAG TPA: CoA transferase [Dehalococcoidales bacterium]
MSRKLFEGFKVADFSAVIAGSMITKTLAAHGAEVIKIEGRNHLDIFRQSFGTPSVLDDPYVFQPWANRGMSFNLWNTTKYGVALNLAHPKGKEIAKKFVARADIVVENFAGGAMEKMGLGYNELKKVKPDLIMLSTCMQGQTGPHSRHPGYGTQLVNLAGFGNIVGYPDREPYGIGPYTDFVAPRYSLLALLAAVDYRRRTGKGQYIDESQYEASVHYMAPLLLDYAVNGRIAERVGNYYPYAAPNNAYPCRARHLDDKWIIIAVYTDEEWQKLCQVMGSPAWTKDPKFATLRARRENEAELDKLIESWTIIRTPLIAERTLRDAGLGARIITSYKEFATHEPPVKNRSPYAAPHNAYRCHWEDRWVAITVSNDEEWRNFCKVLGNPPWTKEAKFATLQARQENLEEMDRYISGWTINRTDYEVMDMMQAAGVSAGVVSTGEDIFEKDLQLRHRHVFWKMNFPEVGDCHGVAPSFTMSNCPVELKRAPLMGEQNEWALKELLGMSDKEIRELILEGVVE